MIKIFLIVLAIGLVADLAFIRFKYRKRDKSTKEVCDRYLLDKYNEVFSCVGAGQDSCAYVDKEGHIFNVSGIGGKMSDNRKICIMADVINEICFSTLNFPIDEHMYSGCRILSFQNFDDINNFSIENLLITRDKFLVQVVFVVPTKENDESELRKISNKIDENLKDFPFRLFSRSIIFINPANSKYGEQFALTYAMSDGDLGDYNSHTILIDSKEF